MLEMRPNCENCDCDLEASSENAMICSFECTFCVDCVTGELSEQCPNCKGEFQPRPPRAEKLLAQYPASTKRVLKK